MLERPGLRLSEWEWERSTPLLAGTAAPEGGLQQFRRIVDLYSNQFLGLVRKEPAPGWNLWRWLKRPVWRVLETEDESLLLTLHCPWGFLRTWEVYDAEDRQVCTIHGNEVFDAAGHLRATMQRRGPSHQRLTSKEGVELATIGRDGEGVELCFAGVIEADPFAKMAVLGTALTLIDAKYRSALEIESGRLPRQR